MRYQKTLFLGQHLFKSNLANQLEQWLYFRYNEVFLSSTADQVKDTDWSPWGRPGGGAPIKDNTGNILTDYKTRAVSLFPLKFLEGIGVSIV